MASPMSGREIGSVGPSHIPSAKAAPEARRTFSLADKKRIVAETEMAGASLSAVAHRHGIGAPLLFRWKKDLAPQTEPLFLPVIVDDEPAVARGTAVALPIAASITAPVIIERPTHGIEVELAGGRRVRFERDTDPETVRAMIAVLEGEAPDDASFEFKREGPHRRRRDRHAQGA